MKFLLNPNESLTAVLSAAATTTAPTYSVRWRDASGENNPVGSTSDTAVTIVSAPSSGQRAVDSIVVYNVDTVAATVTIAKVSSSTSYTMFKTTLQVGDTLVIDDTGVRVLDTNGQQKTSSNTTAVLPFAILPGAWRVHDAYATPLPTTAASDDLAVILGSDGTAFPSIRTSDGKATTVTQIARAIVALPDNYVAGSAITLRAKAGMITTVSDTTATIDFNVYSNDGDATGSADLVETAATTINSLTFSNKDFVITPTGLVAGQLLNVKMTIAITDGATATAVIGAVAQVELRTSVTQ